jgi:hypothetical protein
MVPTFNPALVGDGSGGIIALYSINEQSGPTSYTSTAYLQRISAEGDLLWGEKGRLIDVDKHIIALLNDRKDNLIIVWIESHSIWAQKIDLEWHSLWDVNKIKIADFDTLLDYKVINDDEGGAMVTWLGANKELFLQKIDSAGNLLWPQENRLSDVAGFRLIRFSDGNLVLIWGNGYRGYFVQEINNEGLFSWDTNLSIRLPDTSYSGYFNASITDDYFGGAILNWAEYPGASQPANPSPVSNIFRRIDNEGKITWSIQRPPVDSLHGEIYKNLGDGTGGAFLFSRSDQSIFFEHIDSEGHTLGSESSRLKLYSDLFIFDSTVTGFNIIPDNAGGVVISRLSHANRKQLPRIQRLDALGNKLWSDEGILISGTPESQVSYTLPVLTSFDDSGYIASWIARYTQGNIFVQKIGSNGELLWGQDGIALDAWRNK